MVFAGLMARLAQLLTAIIMISITVVNGMKFL